MNRQILTCDTDRETVCCFTDKKGHSIKIFTTDTDGFDAYVLDISTNCIIRHWDKNDIMHQRNGSEDIFSFIDECAVSIEYGQKNIFNSCILNEISCEGRYRNMISLLKNIIS